MANESRNGSSRRGAFGSAPRGSSAAETPLPDRLWSAEEVSNFLIGATLVEVAARERLAFADEPWRMREVFLT